MHYKICIYSLIFLLLAHSLWSQTVIRGRNEGTFTIPAANVQGNGNITGFTTQTGIYTSKELAVMSKFGLSMGIAQILQVWAQTSFINFNRLGTIDAHMQITTPGNDRLRFLGVALIGDLYLSTSIDTLNQQTDSNKPEFNPYPLFSVVTDLDWMARPRQFPLKTYFFFGMADNPKLLFEYKQVSLKSGVEWKLYQNSLFVEGGLGLYKYKHQQELMQTGYEQKYAWIGPGFRYRLRDRFSVLGILRWTFYREIKEIGSLNPEKISLALKFEAPIIFKETNTEAIRTLVFIEKSKSLESQEEIVDNLEPSKSFLGDFEKTIIELTGEDETFDYKKEKEALIKRREEIEEKMKEIELLLEDDEEEL